MSTKQQQQHFINSSTLCTSTGTTDAKSALSHNACELNNIASTLSAIKGSRFQQAANVTLEMALNTIIFVVHRDVHGISICDQAEASLLRDSESTLQRAQESVKSASRSCQMAATLLPHKTLLYRINKSNHNIEEAATIILLNQALILRLDRQGPALTEVVKYFRLANEACTTINDPQKQLLVKHKITTRTIDFYVIQQPNFLSPADEDTWILHRLCRELTSIELQLSHQFPFRAHAA
mmetsp:Transcript_25384/g.54915  ORF Transcript_25384/g.54915 Transcript_25384/m.54915 type:complete len:238 (-) Transcript_25384:243-956(-)